MLGRAHPCALCEHTLTVTRQRAGRPQAAALAVVALVDCGGDGAAAAAAALVATMRKRLALPGPRAPRHAVGCWVRSAALTFDQTSLYRPAERMALFW